jgi:hypothetical protein
MPSKAAIAFLSVIAAAGCAAPGSALTRFRIQGSFHNHPDCPQAVETFQAILPDRYGLSGLDAAMGDPSQYGHQDQIDRVRIDEHGSFIHEFAQTT